MARLSLATVQSHRSVMNRSRDTNIPYWRTQSKFVSPERFVEPGNSQRNTGRKSTRNILQNTAGLSLRTFVSGMSNGANSRARPWYDLVMVDDSLSSSSADRYLSSCVKILNQHLQLSNFYKILPMSYKDIGIFSNSAYAMLPHAKYGFYFLPFAMGTYSIGTDSEGMVNQFCRDFTLSVRQTVELYGQLGPTGHIDWSNFPAWVQTAWEKSDYMTEVVLNNLILPNSDPRPNSLMAADSMMYQSYTSVTGTGSNTAGISNGGFRYQNYSSDNGKNKSDFVAVKGYDYFPIIANRWEVAPESDWGVDGPAHLAIDDIKSLQETESYRMEAVAKLVKPPMVGPASLRRHQATILAGGITYIDESSEGTKFRAAYEVNPQLADLINSQADYKALIKKAFFEDLFLKMSSEKQISHITAREIEEIAAEKMIGIGPALGQLDQDQNGPVIRNAFHLLSKIKGKLPPAPQSIQGAEIRPEYISILAQAAKASMIGSTDKLVAFVGNLAQVTQDPTITQILRKDVLVRDYGDFLGVDPSQILDEEEYGAIVKGVAAEKQAQMQAQKMQQASETSKNFAASEVTDNNMLGMLGKEQQQFIK